MNYYLIKTDDYPESRKTLGLFTGPSDSCIQDIWKDFISSHDLRNCGVDNTYLTTQGYVKTYGFTGHNDARKIRDVFDNWAKTKYGLERVSFNHEYVEVGIDF